MMASLSITIIVDPSTKFNSKESTRGMVKTASPFAIMVMANACAILPPAAPVITTPLLNVVGITATRKIPMTIPVSIGIAPNSRPTAGATKNIMIRKYNDQGGYDDLYVHHSRSYLPNIQYQTGKKEYQDNHGIRPPMHFKPSPNTRNRSTGICHRNNKNKKNPY